MSHRIHIGIRFIDHKEWTGGVYYVINLVNVLSFLPDIEKPVVCIYCNLIDKKNILDSINYPYLNLFYLDRKLNFVERITNKIFSFFSQRVIFSIFPKKGSVDFVFPNPEKYYFENFKRIFWIPDFQEDYLPHFFSKEEITLRKKGQQQTAEEADFLVLSSESAKEDFLRLYPNSKTKIFVQNFTAIHPEFKNIDGKGLFEKYNLPDKYFFAPNQFWAHKNHFLIIKAIELLKERGKEFVVVFSGKELDYRDPNYTLILKKYVKENGLENNIRFLGFIDRKDQLQLMNLSIGIIQPSLFEGWSTVVEDAKSMSQIIFASDLDVHKEQLENWKGTYLFFNRNDFTDLAEKLLQVEFLKREYSDYTSEIQKYARSILNMAKEISGK